jgi:hypothetical protein
MLLAALVVLGADIAPIDTTSRWRFDLVVGGGFSDQAGEVGASAEVGWMALRFLRLELDAGAAFAANTGQYGIVRLLAGADAVLPLSKAELFVGVESGLTHTNLAHPNTFCFDCIPFSQWQWGPALRIRGGVDLLFWRPFVLGFAIAYSLIETSQFDFFNFGELALRLGAVF